MLNKIKHRKGSLMQRSRSGVQPPYRRDSLWRCFPCPEDTTVGCSGVALLQTVLGNVQRRIGPSCSSSVLENALLQVFKLTLGKLHPLTSGGVRASSLGTTTHRSKLRRYFFYLICCDLTLFFACTG